MTLKCVCSLVLLGVLGVIGCDANTPAAAPPATAAPTGDSTSAPAPTKPDKAPQSPYLTEAKVLGEYTDKRGIRRKYILVSPGLTDTQLVDLGKRLHATEKDAWLWLLDDDSQAKQMLDALPATERGDLTGYPGKWVEAHTVAHSVRELAPGGKQRWVLYKGPYTEAVLTALD